MSLAASPNGSVFAGTTYGTYRTTDDGENWILISPDVYPKHLAITENGYLIGGAWSGLSRSTDNGITWEKIESGLSNVAIHDITINQDQTVYISNDNGVFKSGNYGDSWSAINNELFAVTVTSLKFDGQNNLYAGYEDGKILRSSDSGGSWNLIRNASDLPSLNFNWIKMGSITPSATVHQFAAGENSKLWAATYSGLFYSTDDGITWNQNYLSTGQYYTSFSFCSNVLVIDENIFVADQSGIYKSTNDGNTWTQIFFSSIKSLLKSNNGCLYVITDTKIYYSLDLGKNWIERAPLPENEYVSAYDVTDEGRLYIGTTSSNVYTLPKDGQLFSKCSPPITFESIYCLFCYGENKVIAGTANGIRSSQNNGESWGSISLMPATIYIITGYKGYLFAGHTTLAYSTDFGFSWSNMEEGLIGSGHTSVLGYSNKGYLILERSDGTLYRSSTTIYTSIASVEENKNEEMHYILSQNYPNPFNPATIISYSIPKTSYVTLKVYDILGREVVTLINEEKHPGGYKVDFNANNLSSGVYFYSIRAGNYLETKKMILIR